jgi:hypothetical protein
VYESTDEGSTWSRASSGLPFGTAVADIAVSSSGTVLAATSSPNAFYGGIGVVHANYSVSAVAGPADIRPSGYVLAQNYPNPFNPSTTIHYALPQRSHVAITVFNTLGQKVAELVNAEKEAGTYEATFNANGLASGVYLYSIQAGSFIHTKKLVLLR